MTAEDALPGSGDNGGSFEEGIGHPNRRQVVVGGAVVFAALSAGGELSAQGLDATVADGAISTRLTVNGTETTVQLDPRSSLLDVLREGLGLTGTKKAATTASVGHVRSISMAGA